MQKAVLFIIGLIIVISSCESRRENVARVGSLAVSVDEFKSALADRYAPRSDYQNIEPVKKLEVLSGLINRKLKLLNAFDQNLKNDPAIKKAVRDYREKLIISRYHERVVLDVLVPEEKMKEYIRNQKFEAHIFNILISWRDLYPKADRTMAEARQLAGEVFRQLQEGADFSEVASKYSDDPQVNMTGGDLGYLTRGTLVPELDEAVWNLEVGEISKPLKSRFGYHIIRLEDKRIRQGYRAPETENELFNLKQRLVQSLGDSGRIVWDRQLRNLKERYGYELQKQNVLTIAALITQKIYEGVTTYESFDKSQLDLVLASWNNGKLNLRDLLDEDDRSLNRMLMRYKQAQLLEEAVLAQSLRLLILKDAEKMGLEEEAYVQDLVQKFEESRLVETLERKEVSDKSEPTSEQAEAYYTANPGKFMRPEEIELWEIVVKNESLARHLAAKAKKGENFEQLARQYSQKLRSKEQNGYQGYVSQSARGILSKEAFKLGPGGKIGGPVKYRNSWVVFKTGREKEAEQRPFENVEDRARSLLKNERIVERRISWEDSLRDIYTVTVDTTILNRI